VGRDPRTLLELAAADIRLTGCLRPTSLLEGSAGLPALFTVDAIAEHVAAPALEDARRLGLDQWPRHQGALPLHRLTIRRAAAGIALRDRPPERPARHLIPGWCVLVLELSSGAVNAESQKSWRGASFHLPRLCRPPDKHARTLRLKVGVEIGEPEQQSAAVAPRLKSAELHEVVQPTA
jgi:hypothetical protein